MTRSPNTSCSVCGEPRWRKASDSTTIALICFKCRKTGVGVGVGVQHGTSTRYKNGCRCDECKAAVAAAGRKYRVMVMARDGVSLSAKRKTPHTWISAKVRFAVYERDGWVCQLCDEPVDRTLHPNGRFAASLDHIECKSWALIPDHSPGNLRLAHRACNARRRDRVDV